MTVYLTIGAMRVHLTDGLMTDYDGGLYDVWCGDGLYDGLYNGGQYEGWYNDGPGQKTWKELIRSFKLLQNLVSW